MCALFLASFVLTTALESLGPPAALADAPMSISPIALTVEPTARAASMTIRNPSSDPLRLQIGIERWSPTPSNPYALTPANDVIVFPQLVTIPMFGRQEIRVAVLGVPPPAERAYRIVVTPLPPLNSAAAAGGRLSAALELQARFTFPVFVEPALAQTRGTFTQLHVAHGVLAIRIQNDGNVHLGGEPLTIVARGADGRTIASQEARGWSVLAAHTTTVSVKPNRCAGVRSLTVSAPASMNVREKTVEVSSRDCGS